MGRVLDAVLALLAAPLRTLLYLQCWDAPVLNSVSLFEFVLLVMCEYVYE